MKHKYGYYFLNMLSDTRFLPFFIRRARRVLPHRDTHPCSHTFYASSRIIFISVLIIVVEFLSKFNYIYHWLTARKYTRSLHVPPEPISDSNRQCVASTVWCVHFVSANSKWTDLVRTSHTHPIRPTYMSICKLRESNSAEAYENLVFMRVMMRVHWRLCSHIYRATNRNAHGIVVICFPTRFTCFQ